MEGWISLYRKFTEWEWYDDVNTKSFFIHCLLKANNDEKEWRGKIIKRGQFFCSLNSLSKELNLTIKQIRTSMKKLEKTKEIETQGASNGTMITVCKYDSYQDNKKHKGQAKGQTKGKRRATTNNNNNNNKGKSKPFTPPSIDEINSYCLEKGYSVNSEKIFNYYNDSDWIDSRGNKIINWKQKVLSVWCKQENKIDNTTIEEKYKNHYTENKTHANIKNYGLFVKRKKEVIYKYDDIITIDEFSKYKINGNADVVIISFQNYGNNKHEFLTNFGIHASKY